MAQRYRITRAMQGNGGVPQTISLEECEQFFSSRSDFSYTTVYTVTGAVTMSIEGHFFMWNNEGTEIPFRYYEGDLYVSGTNEAVVPIMMEVASGLLADVLEE